MRLLAAILAALLVLAPWGLWWHERAQRAAEVADLRQQLQQALASKRLREAEDLARRTGTPQRLEVSLPGAGRQEVRVERVEVPLPVFTPAGVQVVEVPKVVTVSPPVPCRSEAECRAMYGAAPQAITVRAELPAGTVVPVAVTGDGQPHHVQAPRAEPFPVSVHLVLSERGVFHALQPEGQPLRVTEVRTETMLPPRVEEPAGQPGQPPAPRRPWRVSLGVGDGAVVALEYENTVAGGWYRLQAGVWVAGPAAGQPHLAAWLVFPLR